jgi:hypothetical protein
MENMADVVTAGKSYLQVLTDILTYDGSATCKNCEIVLKHLKEVQSELSSARVIIELLHNELNSLSSTESTTVQQMENANNDNLRQESVNIDRWITFGLKCSRKVTKTGFRPVLQTLKTKNTHASLPNLHENDSKTTIEDCDMCSNKIITETSSLMKHKIILIGDSHIRDYSGKLAHMLGNSFNVFSLVKPNSDLEKITVTAQSDISKLTKNDDEWYVEVL